MTLRKSIASFIVGGLVLLSTMGQVTPGPGGSGGPTKFWSFVQYAQNPGGSGLTDPITTAYASNVSTGSILLFAYASDQASGTPTFTLASGTATLANIATLKVTNDATHTYSISIGCATVTTGGSASIKGAWSIAGGGNSNLAVVEVTDGTSAITCNQDGTAAGGLGASATSVSTSLTTTLTGDLIFGVAGINTGTLTIFPGTNFVAFNTAGFMQNEFFEQRSFGAVTIPWTSSGATTWLTAAVAIALP